MKAEWNIEELTEELKGKAKAALPIIGNNVQAQAAANTPVITGNLKGSICWATKDETGGDSEAIDKPDDDYTVRIGSVVEYAARVELGFVGTDSLGRSYSQAPKPYLQPALESNKEQIIQIIQDAINK